MKSAVVTPVVTPVRTPFASDSLPLNCVTVAGGVPHLRHARRPHLIQQLLLRKPIFRRPPCLRAVQIRSLQRHGALCRFAPATSARWRIGSSALQVPTRVELQPAQPCSTLSCSVASCPSAKRVYGAFERTCCSPATCLLPQATSMRWKASSTL